MDACECKDCYDDVVSLGYCSRHYYRFKRYGDPNYVKRNFLPRGATVDERFWIKVKKTNECWLWTGAKIKKYGTFWAGEKRENGSPINVYVHVYVWEQANGPKPEGTEIDHRCRTPNCVRLEHLRLTTPKQNKENLSATNNKSSGHRGVYWDSHRKKWRVMVVHNGKKHGTYFDDLDEAVASATQLRNQLFTHNDADRTTKRYRLRRA